MRASVFFASALAALAFASPAGAEPALGQARAVASGSLYAPHFSPDGERLLATGVGGRGLFRVELSGGQVARVLADSHRVTEATFTGAERIAVTARPGRPAVIVDLEGSAVASAPALPGPASIVDDRLFVTHGDGTVAHVGAGDRFFAPKVAPGGKHVVVQGLSGGIYVYDLAARRLVHVGAGTAPSFSADGKSLVYERTEDDGHVILGSDLWLYDLSTGATTRLTATPDRIERRPQLSPDGTRLAFDDDRGTLYVAEMEIAR